MQEQINKILDAINTLWNKKIYQQDIQNNEVKQRHIAGLIVFRGNSTERPTNGSTEKQAFYAEDQKKLYIWNRVNKAWEYATFT